MLSDGRTCGVFQMESAGMTGVCVGLKPKDIEDITAIIALYRPGPMDSIPGSSPPSTTRSRSPTSTPSLEPILANTYGCIVYQEQVIEIFRRLAGYSLGPGRHGPPGHVQEEAGDIQRERRRPSSTGTRNAASPAAPPTASPRPWRRASMTRSPTSPTTPSTKPTPSATPLWPTRPPGSSATTPGVHGRPPHLGAGLPGEDRGIHRRVPLHGHPPAAPGHQPVRPRLHRGRPGHPLRPGRPERGWAGASPTRCWPSARRRGPSAPSPTSASGCRGRT